MSKYAEIAETKQLMQIWWPGRSWGFLKCIRQSLSSRSHLKAEGVHSGTEHWGDLLAFTGHAEQLHGLHFWEKYAGDSREAQWFHLHHIWQQFQEWPCRVFLRAVWTGKRMCSLPCFSGCQFTLKSPNNLCPLVSQYGQCYIILTSSLSINS